MGDYYDLGGHTYPVTTTSDEAQTWFDRGLLWTFGYNHEEAVVCFQKALQVQPYAKINLTYIARCRANLN